MFPMWFVSVCARRLSFTMNKEHARKQGFLEQSACAYQMIWCPFLCLCKENWNDVFGLLNSLGGLGEDPTFLRHNALAYEDDFVIND